MAQTRNTLTRSIRILGAALGGLTGIVLIIQQIALFQQVPGTELLATGWLVAWTVMGFSLLPLLTIIPARAAVRKVQELSTAEFVAAVIGLVVGLLVGL